MFIPRSDEQYFCGGRTPLFLRVVNSQLAQHSGGLLVRETGGNRRRSSAMPSNRGKPTLELYRPPNVRADVLQNGVFSPNPRLNVHAKEFTMKHGDITTSRYELSARKLRGQRTAKCGEGVVTPPPQTDRFGCSSLPSLHELALQLLLAHLPLRVSASAAPHSTS
uniref:Uncharacterized protein n=1 Tax=Timema poppense TaxID=170557 RepID=A0A7R9D4U6_TIMPO|nr:unnamed protein product [Timema poppensis]